MEGKSRKELLQVIENQEKKLHVYEAKIINVVRAYQGLQKEKEALETSLKVLTTNKSSGNDLTASKPSGSDSTASSESSESDNVDKGDKQEGISSTFTDPLQTPYETVEDHDTQIHTLTEALSTLTEEKSRIESAFQADRRKLIQEKDDIAKQLEDEKLQWRSQKEKLDKQIQEFKSRIRDLQQEREKEQQDHAFMIRELQCLLSEERQAKERIEEQLEEMQDLLRKAENDRKAEEYEKFIEKLNQQLRSVQERLKDSEIKANQPSPFIIELQQEMAEMKAQHRIAVQQEKQRANEAEAKLKSLSSVSEERVAGLEAHLSELSQMVGNYDRLRHQDQVSINKLKERITQLDLENTALARTVTIDRERTFESEEDSNLDVQTLIERMTKLKGLIKVANQRSERPVNVEEFMRQEEENESNDQHIRCREELQQLKEEFERYKLRAQSVLNKNKPTKECEAEENQFLKMEIAELKEKLHNTKSEMEANEEHYIKNKEKLKETIQQVISKHKQELLNQEAEYKMKLLELEQQMQKRRDCTLTLLEEKEREIQMLRTTAYPSSFLLEKDYGSEHSYGSKDSPISTSHNTLPQQSSEIESLTNTLSQSLYFGKGEAQFLHYIQEIARKDIEICNMRRARHQAESALRELQNVAIMKEEKYTEEIETLNSRIKRLESSQSQEGMNMEYLKNVVLRYMLCQDESGRCHMLNAIATVLHFTHREFQQVKDFNQSWWWSGNLSKQT